MEFLLQNLGKLRVELGFYLFRGADGGDEYDDGGGTATGGDTTGNNDNEALVAPLELAAGALSALSLRLAGPTWLWARYGHCVRSPSPPPVRHGEAPRTGAIRLEACAHASSPAAAVSAARRSSSEVVTPGYTPMHTFWATSTGSPRGFSPYLF